MRVLCVIVLVMVGSMVMGETQIAIHEPISIVTSSGSNVMIVTSSFTSYIIPPSPPYNLSTPFKVNEDDVPYFGVPLFPPFIGIGTGSSIFYLLDTNQNTLAKSIPLRSIIPPGFMGGGCSLPSKSLWLTGKGSSSLFSLPSMEYTGISANLSSVDVLYVSGVGKDDQIWMSGSASRKEGNGSFAKYDAQGKLLQPGVVEIENGFFPFAIESIANPEEAYVYHKTGVTRYDVATQKLETVFKTEDGEMINEIGCYDADVSVFGSDTAWYIMQKSDGSVKKYSMDVGKHRACTLLNRVAFVSNMQDGGSIMPIPY